MKVFFFLIFYFVLASNLYSQIDSTKDFEKLISNNIKALSIAKSKKDTSAVKNILKEISLNQKLFDTLLLSQILEYQKYSSAYKNNLDSNEFNIIYKNNKLNNELGLMLNINSNNKHIENISDLKFCDLKTEFNVNNNFNDHSSINFEISNLTCFFITTSITIIDAKTNKIINKFNFKIEPNVKDFTYFLENNLSTKDIYFIQAYKYLNTDLKEYYIYNKSNSLKIKGSLEVFTTLKMNNTNFTNNLITPEINYIFKE